MPVHGNTTAMHTLHQLACGIVSITSINMWQVTNDNCQWLYIWRRCRLCSVFLKSTNNSIGSILFSLFCNDTPDIVHKEYGDPHVWYDEMVATSVKKPLNVGTLHVNQAFYNKFLPTVNICRKKVNYFCPDCSFRLLVQKGYYSNLPITNEHVNS